MLKFVLIISFLFSIISYGADVKDLKGFSFTKNFITPDGRLDLLKVKLDPNGRLSYESNHLNSREKCSKRAGHIISNIDEKNHSELVTLAYKAYKSQKKNPSKLITPRKEIGQGMSISVEQNNSYYRTKLDNTSNELIELNKKLKKVVLEKSKIKKHRPWFIELDSQVKNNRIIASISNVGQLDTTIQTGAKGRDSFYLVNGSKKVPLKYGMMKFANLTKKIRPGEKLDIELINIKESKEKGWKLVFLNNINGLKNDRSRPVNATLCDEVTYE